MKPRRRWTASPGHDIGGRVADEPAVGLSGDPPPKDRRPPGRSAAHTILSFVALLYVIEIVDQLSGHSLDRNGIRPLETDGLWGILFAPLLHGGWPHLIANTVPALVLGFLVTLAGMSRFVWATAIIWIVGGFGTWLIGTWACRV
jgi:membrane associated rhomboid family serine protease